MTGLNLETFLHLLRADLGAWASLGVIALLLALLSWTSWGSRRALRKCLVLSVVAHLGLALFGSSYPIVRLSGSGSPEPETSGDRIHHIRVSPQREGPEDPSRDPADGRPGRNLAAWDRPGEALALADPALRPAPPEPPSPDLLRLPPATASEVPEASAPEVDPPGPSAPEDRPGPEAVETPPPAPPSVAPSGPDEVAAPLVGPGDAGPRPRSRTGEAPPRSRRRGRPGARDRPRGADPDRTAGGPPSRRRPRDDEPRGPGLSRRGPPARHARGRRNRRGRRAEVPGAPTAARAQPEALALAVPGDGDLRGRILRSGDAADRTAVRPPLDVPAGPRPSIPRRRRRPPAWATDRRAAGSGWPRPRSVPRGRGAVAGRSRRRSWPARRRARPARPAWPGPPPRRRRRWPRPTSAPGRGPPGLRGAGAPWRPRTGWRWDPGHCR
jgi:hypothetical protein